MTYPQQPSQWSSPPPASPKRNGWKIAALILLGLMVLGAIANSASNADERDGSSSSAPAPRSFDTSSDYDTGGWSSADRSAFMSGCAGDGQVDFCGCAADELEAAYPDAADVPDKDSAEGARAILDAVEACSYLSD